MDSHGFVSPYSPNTDSDRRDMLHAIGVDSVEELFLDIPEAYRNPPLDLPPPKSEMELLRYAEELASANFIPGEYACFLG
ncbi:MAG: glycine dehydrogenase, partial [Chloroflexi bacterium]|nr:glycine dehydrogenase [Chloroflexota bacterium]